MRAVAVVAALFAAAVAVRGPEAAPPAARYAAASYGKIVLLAADGTATRTPAPRGESPAYAPDGRVAFVRDGDVWATGGRTRPDAGGATVRQAGTAVDRRR